MSERIPAPTTDQVARLLADQLPTLAASPVSPLPGSGTTNAIFRIGASHIARFPRHSTSAEALIAEVDAIRRFHLASTFPSPRPLHLGSPGQGYSGCWSVLTWVPGTPADPRSSAADHALARDLATLISSLRSLDTGSRTFQGDGRGGDLRTHDDWVRQCIDRSEGLLDTAAVATTWASLRNLPRHDPDRMSHTDLIPANILTTAGGGLAGILDTGGYQAADPALDLVCAWHLFEESARETLRTLLDCSPLEWERGRAWAFEQAIGLVWYYDQSNPSMADLGRTTLARVLACGPI